MKKVKQLKTYNGSTVAEVQALSDLEVAEALKKLDLKPEPFQWADLSKAQQIERWWDHCWLLEQELRALEPTEKPATPEGFKQLHKFAYAVHRESERSRLICAYIGRWMSSLNREEMIELINHYATKNEDQVTISERRYTADADWVNRLLLIFWPTIQSTSQKIER